MCADDLRFMQKMTEISALIPIIAKADRYVDILIHYVGMTYTYTA